VVRGRRTMPERHRYGDELMVRQVVVVEGRQCIAVCTRVGSALIEGVRSAAAACVAQAKAAECDKRLQVGGRARCAALNQCAGEKQCAYQTCDRTW